jgi:putative spermidine/putrescine transport system permease protein
MEREVAEEPPIRLNRRHERMMSTFRWTVLSVLGVFFLVPLYSMAEFTFHASNGALTAWRQIAAYPDLVSGLIVSLELAAVTAIVTIVLLVPSMIWVRLRLPRLQRTIEFLCLLPLAIPAIVLVVGLAPVYLWVTYLLGNSPITLVFAYVILTMPYAFRSIDAGLMSVDLKTLSEAARSLGARWPTVMMRAIAPNLTGAILNAVLLAVALVIGEFTIASLLNFQTLQTQIFAIGRVNAPVSVATALGSLALSFVLLFLISLAGIRSRSHAKTEG